MGSALDQIRAAAKQSAKPTSALDAIRAANAPRVVLNAAVEGGASTTVQQDAPAVPEPPSSILPPKPPLPPIIEKLNQQRADRTAAFRFGVGLDPELEGNFPAKAAAIREREAKPIEERSYLELAGRAPGNLASQSKDLLAAGGTAIARGARGALDLIREAAGQRQTRIMLPDGQGGEREVTLPFGVHELNPEVKARLVEHGARFGPEPRYEAAPSLAADALGALERRGLAVPPDVVAERYDDRVSIPLPGTDRSIVPRIAAEFASEEPLAAALDVSALAAVPGVALRSGGEAAIRAGAGVERLGGVAAARARDRVAGPVLPNAAEVAGPRMARAGVAAQEAGEALREIHPLSALRRIKDAALTRSELGRERLLQREAGRFASQHINRAVDRSIATRIADQQEITGAIKTLERGDRLDVANDAGRIRSTAPGAPDATQTHVAVTEGRASYLPGAQTEVEIGATRTLRDQAAARQRELVEGGFLDAQEAADRAFGPWVNALTDKRIPRPEWDDARVAAENAKIAARNKAAREADALAPVEPGYLAPREYRSEIEALREFRRSWNEFPEAPEFDPAYFPRFPTGKDDAISLRKIAAEFFPKRGREAGKQAFQKFYTGLSFLTRADPLDVREALVRYNAQVRKVVDSHRMVKNVLDGEVRVPVGPGKWEMQKVAKPLHFDKNGDPLDLLPGHRPYDPEGMLQFYRGQVDMSEAVAKALDDMGELESALAAGIREALPKGLNKQWLAVRKRRTIYQVPESLAKQMDRHFGEVPAPLRIWDKATDAWKAAVLAYSPRWYVNNLVGNTVMEVMAGGNPARLARPVSSAEAKVLPVELRGRGMVQNEGYIRDLGQARTSLAGSVMDAVSNSRVMTKVGNTTDFLLGFNSLVDNHFRAKLYLDLGRKEARNALVKRTGRAYFNSREILTEMGKAGADPKRLNKLLDSLDGVFVNFNNLTPFERQWIRRVVPFWSWYREIARVTASLPKRSPVRAQAARALAGLAKDADEREFEDAMGFPKRWLREHQRQATFTGVQPTGEGTQLSTHGVNPYAGAFSAEFSKLHPVAQWGAQEAFGGRTLGGFGSFVPFRTITESASATSSGGEGVQNRQGVRAGAALRAMRMLPFVRQAEDAAQKATEGRVTQRYDDVTPFANLARKALGKPVVPTAVYDYESRTPRRERPATDAVAQWAGIPLQRFVADEELEQQVKARKVEATRWARESWRDPADREALERAAREHAGTPFEGMRTFDPPAR